MSLSIWSVSLFVYIFDNWIFPLVYKQFKSRAAFPSISSSLLRIFMFKVFRYIYPWIGVAWTTAGCCIGFAPVPWSAFPTSCCLISFVMTIQRLTSCPNWLSLNAKWGVCNWNCQFCNPQIARSNKIVISLLPWKSEIRLYEVGEHTKNNVASGHWDTWNFCWIVGTHWKYNIVLWPFRRNQHIPMVQCHFFSMYRRWWWWWCGRFHPPRHFPTLASAPLKLSDG